MTGALQVGSYDAPFAPFIQDRLHRCCPCSDSRIAPTGRAAVGEFQPQMTQHLTPATNQEHPCELNAASGGTSSPDRIWQLHVWRECTFVSASWTLVALGDLAALP